MKKLTLAFFDEQGSNLNQYKMKRNVGTVSETQEVIQLERDANITTQGTLLTADRLNGIVKAINSTFLTIYEEIPQVTQSKALALNTAVNFKLGINEITSEPLSFSDFSWLMLFKFYFKGATEPEKRYATVTVGMLSYYSSEHSEIVQIYDSFADTTQKVKILLDKSNNTITITNLTNSNTTTNVLYIESIIGA